MSRTCFPDGLQIDLIVNLCVSVTQRHSSLVKAFDSSACLLFIFFESFYSKL